MSNVILDADQIHKKLRRIAFEIYEQNYNEKEICLIGIRENGYQLALLLTDHLKDISGIKVHHCGITLNKSNPLSHAIISDCELDFIKSKTVILVDDVAHSGKTLMYALKPLMDKSPKKIQIAVLVDRKHKRFPITADYVGLLLSTGVHEMVHVQLGKNLAAFVE
jgi:pyrimidine operon attenuation protein/uracil phosphoribosyltransferase